MMKYFNHRDFGMGSKLTMRKEHDTTSRMLTCECRDKDWEAVGLPEKGPVSLVRMSFLHTRLWW